MLKVLLKSGRISAGLIGCAVATTAVAQPKFSPQLGVAVSRDMPDTAGATNVIGMPRSVVLTINSNEFYAQSAYGQHVAQDIQARSAVLAAENSRIEAELKSEEQDLAKRRKATDPGVFRTLAEAFDKKVQNTRTVQEKKSAEITSAEQAAQREFQKVALPVLEDIMTETGAAVILEQSNVLLSATSVDVTDLAISRLNAILDGKSMQNLTPEGGHDE